MLRWPARGVRLRVQDATGATIAEGRADTSGCFKFDDVGVPGQTTFRNVRVYYDTRVGTRKPGEFVGRIQVRGFFDKPEVDANTDVSIQFQNVGFAPGPNNTYGTSVTIGSGVAPMSISMASVSHTLHRVDTAMTDNKPANPPILKVILQNCQYSAATKWSCMDTLGNRLFLTPDANNGSTRRKFVSGHETGHWLDYNWGIGNTWASSGGIPSYIFASNQQDDLEEACRFTWVDNGNGGQGSSAHAMRSQEYQHAAVSEAFAHFMALFSFNEASAAADPEFQYYKKQAASVLPPFVDGSYPAEDVYFGATTITSANIAVPYAYLESPQGCDCAANGNCEGTSTQMQWMRAYWWYLLRDEPGGMKPSLSQFFAHMEASSKSGGGVSCSSSVDRCYGAVTAGLPPSFVTRWQSIGVTMGLATDEP